MRRGRERTSSSGDLTWRDIATGAADRRADSLVTLTGWMAPPVPASAHDYFLLAPRMVCCIGCLPSDPREAVEVFAAAPIAAQAGEVTLRGRLVRLYDDDAGWL